MTTDTSLGDIDIRYLISRLERIAELLRSDEPSAKHMALAKVMADLAALKSLVGDA